MRLMRQGSESNRTKIPTPDNLIPQPLPIVYFRPQNARSRRRLPFPPPPAASSSRAGADRSHGNGVLRVEVRLALCVAKRPGAALLNAQPCRLVDVAPHA